MGCCVARQASSALPPTTVPAPAAEPLGSEPAVASTAGDTSVAPPGEETAPQGASVGDTMQAAVDNTQATGSTAEEGAALEMGDMRAALARAGTEDTAVESVDAVEEVGFFFHMVFSFFFDMYLVVFVFAFAHVAPAICA